MKMPNFENGIEILGRSTSLIALVVVYIATSNIYLLQSISKKDYFFPAFLLVAAMES